MSDGNQNPKVGSRRSLINPRATTEVKPREARSNTNQLMESVEQLVIYTPTPAQRKAKARLLVALEDNPIASLEGLNCAAASRLANYQFSAVWNEPGFQQWLTGSNEFRERVEYLAHLCLDKAEDILLSDDAKLAGAQVALIGRVSELANKLPKHSGRTGSNPDDQFSNMSLEQIQQWLVDAAAQLPQRANIVNVNEDSEAGDE